MVFLISFSKSKKTLYFEHESFEKPIQKFKFFQKSKAKRLED